MSPEDQNAAKCAGLKTWLEEIDGRELNRTDDRGKNGM